MSANQPGLGEQVLSKATEIGLSTQLDEVEELNVDIRTNPIQVMQGELESVSMNFLRLNLMLPSQK
ncbi:MAG: LmeA family phospholipid-binding protein [Phormidium sp.]